MADDQLIDDAVIDESKLIDEPGNTPPSSRAPDRRRRIPTALLVVVGLAVGSVIGLGAAKLFQGSNGDQVTHLSLENAQADAIAEHAIAKPEFLAAWRRYRSATYSAELIFERVTSGGESLRSTSTYVQSPPRRIIRQSDSLLLTDGANSRTCNTVASIMTCAAAPESDYDAAVANEVAIWLTALDGDHPYYLVARDGDGCYQLDLAVVLTDPPYGQTARFCFDAATSALTKRQIIRNGSTDTEQTVNISTTIPADAFTVPEIGR